MTPRDQAAQLDVMNSMADIKAVLLVGGLGTRLRAVLPSAPKPLASLGDKSFLELPVRQLQRQGIRRLVMCTGYLAEQIEKEFGNGSAWNVEVEYSREQQPMGTGGALKLAERFLADAPYCVVMNGDSFLEVNFGKLVDFHKQHGGPITIAVVTVPNAQRYGTVLLDQNKRVTGFVEKTGKEAPGVINAGVYVFSREFLSQLPEGPASLERDIFPRILDQRVYAFESDGIFIDIGTPEDYARARAMCDRLEQAAASMS